MLIRTPDDYVFARQAVERADAFARQSLPPSQAIALADRLADLGFPDAAASILTDAARETSAGKMTAAKIAIANREGGAAYSILDGLEGASADMLRVAAMQQLGEHQSAARILETRGMRTEAAQEAWRGGDWEIVARDGTRAQRDMIKASGIAADPFANGDLADARAPLSSAEALIQSSRSDRNAIDAFLKNLPSP